MISVPYLTLILVLSGPRSLPSLISPDKFSNQHELVLTGDIFYMILSVEGIQV